MTAKLITIGNSLGLRIPKSVLQALGLSKEQEVIYEIIDNKLIITRAKHPREGWGKSFKKMHKNGDDRLIFPENLEDDWD